MPSSHSLASPARRILMRLIFVTDHPRCRRHRTTARRRTANCVCQGGLLALDVSTAAGSAATADQGEAADWREKLLAELGPITSADLARIGAEEALPAKNSLAAADAKLVEDAFERRLSELAPSQSAEAADDGATSIHVDLA